MGSWVPSLLSIVFPPLAPYVQAYGTIQSIKNGDLVNAFAGVILGPKTGISKDLREFVSNAQQVYNVSRQGIEAYLTSYIISQAETVVFGAIKDIVNPDISINPIDGTRTQIWSDGTKVIEFVNGVKTVIKKDGTITTSYPNGTIQILRPNGSVTQIEPGNIITVLNPGVDENGIPNPEPDAGTYTQVLGDGTKIIEEQNGNRTIQTPDGVKTVITPDNTQIQYYPNGSKTVTYADGSQQMFLFDGTQLNISANGTQVFIGTDGTQTATMPDGTLVVTSPNGDRSIIEQNGTVTTYPADGSQIQTLPDGTEIVHMLDGTQIATELDGTITRTAPDGTKVVSDPNGNQTTYWTDGTAIEIAADGTHIEYNADGSKIEYYSDGTKSEFSADGTITEYSLNGDKTVYMTDGTFVEFIEDGTTIVNTADGASTEYATDGSRLAISVDGVSTFYDTDGNTMIDELNGDRTLIDEYGNQTTYSLGGSIVEDIYGTIYEYSRDGSIMSLYEDGTRWEYNGDGTVSETFFDGSRAVYELNGTTTVYGIDDTITVYDIDGTETVYYPDGTSRVTYSNGDQEFYYDTPYEGHSLGNPVNTAQLDFGSVQSNALDAMTTALGVADYKTSVINGKEYVCISQSGETGIYLPKEQFDQYVSKFQQSVKQWLDNSPNAKIAMEKAMTDLNNARSQLQFDSKGAIIQNSYNAQIVQQASENFYNALGEAGITEFFDEFSNNNDFSDFHFETLPLSDHLAGDGSFGNYLSGATPIFGDYYAPIDQAGSAPPNDINARFSNAVYKDNTSPAIPDGYHSIMSWNIEDTGYYAEAFSNGERIVVAFRGTEPTSLKDLGNDASLAGGASVAQFYNVEQTYNDLKTYIANNEQYQGLPISATGHSLGGANAQYLTVVSTDAGDPIPSVTYGALAITSSAAEHGHEITDTSQYAVVNYINIHDTYSTFGAGARVGTVVTYDMINAAADPNTGISTAISNHSMKTYEFYLSESHEYLSAVNEAVTKGINFAGNNSTLNSLERYASLNSDSSVSLNDSIVSFLVEGNDEGAVITTANAGQTGNLLVDPFTVTTTSLDSYKHDVA